MNKDQLAPIARPDTMFGVCHALGEDLRISPTLLRLAFAGALFWNPVAALAAYAALGAIVLFSRWLVPNPKAAFAPEPEAALPAVAERQREPESLPLAA